VGIHAGNAGCVNTVFVHRCTCQVVRSQWKAGRPCSATESRGFGLPKIPGRRNCREPQLPSVGNRGPRVVCDLSTGSASLFHSRTATGAAQSVDNRSRKIVCEKRHGRFACQSRRHPSSLQHGMSLWKSYPGQHGVNDKTGARAAFRRRFSVADRRTICYCSGTAVYFAVFMLPG
jgi:hypothetical protein